MLFKPNTFSKNLGKAIFRLDIYLSIIMDSASADFSFMDT